MLHVPLELRPRQPEDEVFLFELYRATRDAELAAWGLGAAELEAMLEMQYRARRHQYRATFPNAEDRIVVLGGRPIGQLVTDTTREAVRIVDVALVPEHRGAGIGRALVCQVLDAAARAGQPVRLRVRYGSRAIRLYERLGFEAVDDDGVYVSMERCHELEPNAATTV